MSADRETEAKQRFQEAFAAQMEGDYDRAVELYLGSLALHPTAEAYTFLGWTYHCQGKIEEAIAECKRAIKVDPDFVRLHDNPRFKTMIAEAETRLTEANPADGGAA